MKKFFAVIAASALLFGGVGTLSRNGSAEQANYKNEYVLTGTNADNLQIRAKSAYLMDFGTGTPIYAQKETERLPIASMCKIMTLLLSFEAIDSGVVGMEDTVRISERASSMGGSQVFLEANAEYPVKELIKSIVVCSANDSCVAMAETVAGSEEIFVSRMNERAAALGAHDTLFSNCTGLPKEPQYSCAKDVAIMLKELLKHEEYYQFGSVWMDKFQHPEGRYTEITNTNKLIRFYDGCDGGKTGFTNQAGFCLAATAKRNDMRVISVVIGADNSANRFNDTRSMFDYAFANYAVTPIVEAEKPLEQSVPVDGGKQKQVGICPSRSSYAFNRRGEKSNITTELRFERLRAPIAKGDKVGELIVYKDNVEMDSVELIALTDIQKASFWDRLQNVCEGWNAR